jgi:hypothetical protein
MSLKIDILLDNGSQDNFGTQLIRLYMKADNHNKYLLAKAFPNMVKVYNQWYTSDGDMDKVEDLPYD